MLLTFIKLPFVLKTFVLSIFDWQLKSGFTVYGIIAPILLNIAQNLPIKMREISCIIQKLK